MGLLAVCIGVGMLEEQMGGDLSLWSLTQDELVLVLPDLGSVILNKKENGYIGQRSIPHSQRLRAILSANQEYMYLEVYEEDGEWRGGQFLTCEAVAGVDGN